MSEATPMRSAAPKLHAGTVLALLLWLLVLFVQWRFPGLPPLASTGPATLVVLGLALLLHRQARGETALADKLRQETARCTSLEIALRQARNMAAIGRLTRGLAHDFNNHLTAVSSNIELLARRLPPDSGTLPRLADAAIEGVRRAALLTHRLLSLSRRHAEEAEPLDLGRLVTNMAELLRRALGESIVIKTALAEGLWLAWADPNRVERALLDFALNARDAMPDGGTLRIETANISGDAMRFETHPPGDWVVLAVSDTGTGAVEAAEAGAGEALTGAQLRIARLPGQGTTVRLYLPRYVVQPLPSQTEPAAAGGGRPDRTGTILLVEDDDTVRHAAAAALRDLGYEVLEAPDAMEAFRLVADRGGIDLLFTDIGLPGGVDGRALADAARNLMPGLKVLFTTGYGAAPSAGAVEQNDMLFLAKPFSLAQLEAKVREALPVRAPAPALAIGGT